MYTHTYAPETHARFTVCFGCGSSRLTTLNCVAIARCGCGAAEGLEGLVRAAVGGFAATAVAASSRSVACCNNASLCLRISPTRSTVGDAIEGDMRHGAAAM